MVNIMLGEVIFGGVGAGLYGMLIFVILTVFIAGLMVGRTPEYLGKKITAKEVKLAVLAVLILPLSILGGAALAAVLPEGVAGVLNPGPHGLSEILYAYTSATGNNGSAFAGLTANALYHDIMLGVAMLLGRFIVIIPTLAIAGALVAKKITPPSAGTFPTTGPPVRRPPDRRDSDRRRPRLLSGSGFGPDRRASGGGRRHPLRLLKGTPPMSKKSRKRALFDGPILRQAAVDALRKLDPRVLFRNPVIFVTAVAALLSTLIFARDLGTPGAQSGLIGQIAAWLWFTVLFANFAEAVAEGRGKAQAASLRRTKTDTQARKVSSIDATSWQMVSAATLRSGDLVAVQAGDIIPGDGDVVSGIATVNESAITGESAPVIRESGGDRSAVTGGTTVVSDRIVVRISANPGESFLDRMITLVEGAKRQKTPNEIALTILLVGLTIIFLFVVVSLRGFASYSGVLVPVVFLVALLITLDPDDHRRPAVGDRHRRHGPAGPVQRDRHVRPFRRGSGRHRRPAARQDRHHHPRQSSGGGIRAVGGRQRARTGRGGDALLARRRNAGRQVDRRSRRRPLRLAGDAPANAPLHRVLGAHPHERRRCLGHDDPQGRPRRHHPLVPACWWRGRGGVARAHRGDRAGRQGRWHAAGRRPRQPPAGRRLPQGHRQAGHPRALRRVLRRMGIRTVMITGDNPLTAAAIAAEAGVDDFLAEATPEKKLELIRGFQAGGRLVAMCGDGTNDAPALAQADVGVAMNTGTQAANEAGNMVDLDSDPTKLIEIVMIGKQLLISRGALTTFSIANDVAKYFAIMPALFVGGLSRRLQALNVMDLATPGKRHPVGDHLQRADHHRPDPAGAEGRALPPGAAPCSCCAATC